MPNESPASFVALGMGATRRRRRSAATAAVAVAATAAGSVLLAVPAAACACPQPTVRETLAAKGAVAVVERVDDGEQAVGRLRVLEAYGADLAAEIVDDLEGGGDCTPDVRPGTIAVLAFERRDGEWRIGGCHEMNVPSALHRLHGLPRAVRGGTPVAYAAGDYGGATLAAIDAQGRVVAWDRRRGKAGHVAVCPASAGRPGAVVVIGHEVSASAEEVDDAPDAYSEGPPTLTVHDPRSLRVRRAVELQMGEISWPQAVRCADRRARVVQVLLTGGQGATAFSRLITVDGTHTRSATLGAVTGAAAFDGGFVATKGDARPWVVRVDADGTEHRLARLDRLSSVDQIAVSPDGRSVAVVGQWEDLESYGVVTLDGRTGRALGRWVGAGGGDASLAWASGDRLYVRGDGYGGPSSPLLSFARDLSDWGRVGSSFVYAIAAAGPGVAWYGYGLPLRARAAGGGLVTTADPRLVGTLRLAAVPGAAFGPGATAVPTAGPGVIPAAEPASQPEEGDPPRGATAAAAALLALVLAGAIILRRRRCRGN